MRLEELQPGFSTADTGYPEFAAVGGRLSVRFASSQGQPVCVEFVGVPAFAWQENGEPLLPGEPWDGACELFDSSMLLAHPPGMTIGALPGLRHIRLNFNAWGRLDVLCLEFSTSAR